MKQNGCKFKRAVAGASLAMLLALQGAPAVALANESIELDGANAIAVVEEEQQAVASLEEGQEGESHSEATNTVFGSAEEVSFGIPVEREFSYDAKGNFETYYYKFKTSTFHARYQVTLDSLSGKRVHFEVRDQNNEKWKGTGGSTAKNFCYTTSRGYCYKDNADFDTWFYVKVVHCQADRYDKFRLTVTELPSISSATVTGIKASKWYTGKEIEQEPVVELDGVTLREGYDYSISYKNNKLVGMATMTITGAGAYSGTIVETFEIVNAKNPIKAKATKSSVAVSYAKVKKQKVTLSSNIKVSKAKGTVSYKNASSNATAKKFSVNGSSGKVTVPAGTKKGTYTIKVKVTASGAYGYNKGSKTVSYKIVVK